IVCFNEQVDRHYDIIKVGNVYTISNGRLRKDDKKFNNLSSEYEISLNGMSKVEASSVDDGSIPFNKFHFVSIGEITNLEANTMIEENISEIEARGSLSVEKPLWLSLRGTIVSIDEMDCFTYLSCSSMHMGTLCRKKTTKNFEGNWICSACDVISVDCDYRYLFRVQITDHTRNLRATLFDDVGKDLIGETVKETYGYYKDVQLCNISISKLPEEEMDISQSLQFVESEIDDNHNFDDFVEDPTTSNFEEIQQQPLSFAIRMGNTRCEMEEVRNIIENEGAGAIDRIDWPTLGLSPVNEYNTE
ncbi:hypothetical protein KI387_027240, partial [Taxus chinensis]